MILTELIHDLAEILCLFSEPQWAVVGDTLFKLGCRYSETIVFPGLYMRDPDSRVPEYETPCGVYAEGCGLFNVHLSWGHDEYLYHVVKDHIPAGGHGDDPPLRSFYPAMPEIVARTHLFDQPRPSGWVGQAPAVSTRRPVFEVAYERPRPCAAARATIAT